MYGRAVALAFAISLTTAPLSAQRRATAEDTARAVQLLGRATFGVRPQDLTEVLRVGRRAWLDRQLHPERIDDAALTARLDAFPATRMAPDELKRYFSPPGALRKQAAAQRASGGPAVSAMDSVRRPRVGPGGTAQRWRAELVTAKLNRAAFSERQLEEVMTDFWFNHFNVFLGKGGIIWLAQDYEEKAIRPHVFGKFEDLLVATATHPAMLLFLDNAQSVVPGVMPVRTASAARPARERGVNENYARELMELHTLGVDGGYTQQDVREVARVFTGWTIDRGAGRAPGGDAHFVFRARLHDQGEKVVRGERIAPAGQEEGLRLLHRLAHDPATAHHIARELAESFVSDHPDPAFVEQLARTFLRTDGDLREVTRQLFLSEAFYAPRNRATKLKTPLELVASALRATTSRVDVSPPLLQALRELGEVPYMNPSPTGYPASSAAWTSSGALLARMNFGLALGAGRMRGISPDPGLSAQTDVGSLAARLLPGRDTRELVAAVRADVEAHPGDPGRAMGLILGSPDFQEK